MAGRKQAAGSAGPSSVGRGLTVHRGEVSLHGRLLGEVARRTVGPGKVLLGKPFQQDSAVLFLLGSAKKKILKFGFLADLHSLFCQFLKTAGQNVQEQSERLSAMPLGAAREFMLQSSEPVDPSLLLSNRGQHEFVLWLLLSALN